MAGLQRSAVSFRRQGSSGLIWDDKLFSGDLKRFSEGNPSLSDSDQVQTAENDQSMCSKTTIGSINTIRRNRSNNSGERPHRTGKASPATEPPSPRVPVCGFCSAFVKVNKTQTQTASRKRSLA
ncbi:uncharacterized protein At1g15400-like [Cynara cardunculus var. scolymus]|uniref:Uncharacterized protein n=1 Tax=Cynara cardunculus var. scolymus TaxID=59895 RepID=A0A118JV27_CYNCS|nr:uncharacterized protein At1g15400-like [Cynara cardunculus var. scolymus]KVH93009.1 hypothetical protein Ccrd_004934 [Cynara cardunculus var. scolymus]